MADPRLAQIMASQPSTESTLTSGLEACLANFTAKVVALAGECRAAALAVADNLIRGLDQKTPELPDKVMPTMESFVEKQWQEREKGLKFDIQQLWQEVLRSEEEDSMETSPNANHRANNAQRYDSDASSRSSSNNILNIRIVECRYMSKISHPLRPPLLGASCIIFETCSSLSARIAIDEIVLNDMPSLYFVLSMSPIKERQYLMNAVNISSGSGLTLRTEIGTNTRDAIGLHNDVRIIVTRDNSIVLFTFADAMVLKDGNQIGQINIKCKYRNASADPISGRYYQELNDDIYIPDTEGKLWRISWPDIIARRYTSHTVVDNNVEDFYMHEHGNAILKTTGIIALSGGQSIKMQDFDSSAKWSTVIRSANRWLACGDKKTSTSTIVSIDDQGVIKSSISVPTKAVGGGRAFIQHLKTAIVKGDQAIILAIDISTRCHLISMTASGRLNLIESMPSIWRPDIEYPDDKYKVITTITHSDIEGQYVVAGYSWIRKLTVRLN